MMNRVLALAVLTVCQASVTGDAAAQWGTAEETDPMTDEKHYIAFSAMTTELNANADPVGGEAQIQFLCAAGSEAGFFVVFLERVALGSRAFHEVALRWDGERATTMRFVGTEDKLLPEGQDLFSRRVLAGRELLLRVMAHGLTAKHFRISLVGARTAIAQAKRNCTRTNQ